MSSITLPARKSPVRNEEAASTSNRITSGLIRALPSRWMRGWRSSRATTLGPYSCRRRSASAAERPPFEVCSFCNTSSGSLPAASRSSGETWMADDGLWGPCGIRLGSTEVGKIGMIHLVSLPERGAAALCATREVSL